MHIEAKRIGWQTLAVPVAVTILANASRRRDIANCLKIIGDSVEQGGIIKNDNLIDYCLIIRSPDTPKDTCQIAVKELK